MARRYDSLEARLIANSYLTDEPECRHGGTPCWIWLGAVNAAGYPQINLRVDGRVRRVLAHRLSLEVFRGKRARRDRVAKHLCNVKRCVNPMHLEFGTQSTNIRQCVKEGRHFTPFRKEQAAA